VTSAVGGAFEFEYAAAFEDAVEDGLGEVGVVEDSGPGGEGFVGGDDNRAALEVSLVDDLEEDVGGVEWVGEVAEFVDDEDGGVDVGIEGFGEFALRAGNGESGDEVIGVGEEGVGAVLDGAVGDGDGEVSLAEAGGAAEDEVSTFGEELGAEVRAEEGETDGGLEGEIEVLDGGEEGEASAVDGALDAGLGAVSDLLSHEGGQEVAVGDFVLFRTGGEIGIEAAHGGEVEAPEESIEVEGGGLHAASRASAT